MTKAYALLRSEAPKQALSCLKEAQGRPDENDDPRLHLYLALAYQAVGDQKLAAAELAAANQQGLNESLLSATERLLVAKLGDSHR